MYIQKKYQERIDEMIHDDDGWWIYLNRGWFWDDHGLHIIHEDTKAEAIQQLKYTEPCDCPYCKGEED